ncbi:MAG: hypothetical protein J3K34DRAFT_39417 [Monoraphidium minutum]|nr:MAG: hypothetical protein J3K34DRAFT_39417 [Monoraphidium minutum]
MIGLGCYRGITIPAFAASLVFGPPAQTTPLSTLSLTAPPTQICARALPPCSQACWPQRGCAPWQAPPTSLPCWAHSCTPALSVKRNCWALERNDPHTHPTTYAV